MARSNPNPHRILLSLERLHPPQNAAGPIEPYEVILFLDSGDPAADNSFSKEFALLKREAELDANRPVLRNRMERGDPSRPKNRKERNNLDKPFLEPEERSKGDSRIMMRAAGEVDLIAGL